MRYLPGWLIIIAVLVVLLPNVLSSTYSVAGQVLNAVPTTLNISSAPLVSASGVIAPMFTQEVRYWTNDIQRWAAQYNLDPNLLATIMQIESCGHPDVSSSAGAQGLFQVMPFHFDAGENQIDPDTNAMRGANFLNQCLGWASGDPNLAMACYNGGPGVLSRPYSTWANETQRYYQWGSSIYADAIQNKGTSEALTSWLTAGGSGLCTRAANNLGLVQ
jgi:soluble lytic murein transglycosylase-like protein